MQRGLRGVKAHPLVMSEIKKLIPNTGVKANSDYSSSNNGRWAEGTMNHWFDVRPACKVYFLKTYIVWRVQSEECTGWRAIKKKRNCIRWPYEDSLKMRRLRETYYATKELIVDWFIVNNVIEKNNTDIEYT